ncbi:hypothetical protein HOU02_gp350 [Caulobacter phage CcrBL9]|uniref:Uncharacterized protein n=1 Tax=Caulobacter phage CcrBL9 TaxID=2283270 RepID=A0A385EEC8_9CAUD|nr:hypothetical protein HOU02_gp350 [Caulobacter phage CcrBL9]AXQ69375.1 hypothetical protein CcrBL9_gp351 [Caulobacter phage CcrBL9]
MAIIYSPAVLTKIEDLLNDRLEGNYSPFLLQTINGSLDYLLNGNLKYTYTRNFLGNANDMGTLLRSLLPGASIVTQVKKGFLTIGAGTEVTIEYDGETYTDFVGTTDEILATALAALAPLRVKLTKDEAERAEKAIKAEARKAAKKATAAAPKLADTGLSVAKEADKPAPKKKAPSKKAKHEVLDAGTDVIERQVALEPTGKKTGEVQARSSGSHRPAGFKAPTAGRNTSSTSGSVGHRQIVRDPSKR